MRTIHIPFRILNPTARVGSANIKCVVELAWVHTSMAEASWRWQAHDGYAAPVGYNALAGQYT